MKRYFFAFKASLLLGLSGFAFSLFALNPEPLFYVSLVNTNASEHTLIVRAKTNRSYPNLGVQVNHPDFSFADASNNGNDSILCKLNPANQFCLFSSAPRAANQFTLLRRSNGVSTKAKVDIQVALNAKGNAPLSVQNFRTEPVTPGRIIGYLYGWVAPPPAAEVAAAHYTHVLIAFGLFSTSAPGTINVDAVSGFDLKTYVAELQAQGVKVLLSIGGASTNIPDTTVSFDQAVSLAATPGDFKTTFNASLASLVATYGFNGFDFDIESGLNAADSFSDPTEGCTDDTAYNSKCDIAYLASIINTFYTSSPNTLFTMAPQVPNIGATSGFSAVWGNYAALIMLTAPSLEWVGFQTYNTGCVFGIDAVCYPIAGTTLTNSPDSAVAFATDLLENWPATTPTGQPTGFRPYISRLKPSQVVLGYVSVNASGASDGSPPVVISVTKSAVQCLHTGEGCDNYKPPHTYSDMGGVFAWTLNYDASNNYAFSNGLYPCVVGGDCSN